jgi:hypothetical protein
VVQAKPSAAVEQEQPNSAPAGFVTHSEASTQITLRGKKQAIRLFPPDVRAGCAGSAIVEDSPFYDV